MPVAAGWWPAATATPRLRRRPPRRSRADGRSTRRGGFPLATPDTGAGWFPAAAASLRRIPTRLLPAYGLVFIAGMVQSALAPLGPLYAQQLHLSRVQLGELFAASGFSTLLVVLPIGLFSDRIGSRRLSVGAAWLIAASSLGQGARARLLAAARQPGGLRDRLRHRLDSRGRVSVRKRSVERRSARLGATIPVSGVAVSIGPAFAGVLAAQAGVGIPFALIAAAAVLIAVALSRWPVLTPPATRAAVSSASIWDPRAGVGWSSPPS